MSIALSQEERMLKDLVAKFVRDELMPLENKVLARDAAGEGHTHGVRVVLPVLPRPRLVPDR